MLEKYFSYVQIVNKYAYSISPFNERINAPPANSLKRSA